MQYSFMFTCSLFNLIICFNLTFCSMLFNFVLVWLYNFVDMNVIGESDADETRVWRIKL